MSEKNMTTADHSSISAGAMLRQAREKQGLTLEEAATQLNLRPSLLNDLETEQFDRLKVSTYRRGYLRAYARLLGLDENVLLATHDQTHGREEEILRPTHFEPITHSNRWGKWVFRLATVIVIFVIILLTALWWKSRGGNNLTKTTLIANETATNPANINNVTTPSNPTLSYNQPSQSINPQSIGVNTPLIVKAPIMLTDNNNTTTSNAPLNQSNINSNNSDNELTAKSINTTTAANTMVIDNPEATEHITQSSNPDNSLSSLVLKFNQDAWVRIMDANNKIILIGTQAADSQQTLNGQPPFKLTIGNASQVSIDYQGQPVNLNQYISPNNVASFKLGD